MRFIVGSLESSKWCNWYGSECWCLPQGDEQKIPVLLKAARSSPDAARSRPDIVRRPTPPRAVQRPPHQTGKCPRIRLQLGDVNLSKLWAALVHIYFILHGMMTLHKLWGLILENCNIREFWTAGVSFKCVKRLKCILHYTYTLSKLWLFLIIYLWLRH